MGFRARMLARLAALGVDADELATVVPLYESHVARFVRALVGDDNMQQAVLDRAWLAENWSLRDHAPCEDHRAAAIERLLDAEQRRGLAPDPHLWPSNVSPNDLAKALRTTGDSDANLLATNWAKGLFVASDDSGRPGVHPSLFVQDTSPEGNRRVGEEVERAMTRWPLLTCVRVVSAFKLVHEDLHKPAIAIDAGKAHHELMIGWSRGSAAGKIHVDPQHDRAELVLPGAEHRPALLTLPLDGEGLSQAFIQAIKEWRSFLGLRHWIALQALFSIQGKRQGRVVWKLEDHLDALGVASTWRKDQENRASVAREIALLTKMQLVIYHPDGTVRARHSILMTASEIEVERGGTWQLEGLELQMHPWLYGGVRDQKTGQLGKHWHPAPPELAKIDHDKFRHALVLGLILPIRWKWAWAKNQSDHIVLQAHTLLDLACIDLSSHHMSRTWETLERNLRELVRIGLLGHVEWEGEKHTLAAKVRLYPAEWLLDRTLQGLHPIKKALPSALPSNGTELAKWRRARGWTQIQLATKLKVGVRTIRRGEAATEERLGRALIKAIQTLDPTLSPEPPKVTAMKRDSKLES